MRAATLRPLDLEEQRDDAKLAREVARQAVTEDTGRRSRDR
jgi:hypothetical protein